MYDKSKWESFSSPVQFTIKNIFLLPFDQNVINMARKQTIKGTSRAVILVATLKKQRLSGLHSRAAYKGH